MPQYYVNNRAQSNGVHIVHRAWCVWMPYVKKKISLGYFPDCQDAVAEAKKHYKNVNGCEVCSPECHRSG